MLTSHHDIITTSSSSCSVDQGDPSLAPPPPRLLPLSRLFYLNIWCEREKKTVFLLLFLFLSKVDRSSLKQKQLEVLLVRLFCSLVTLTPFFKKTSSFCVNKSQTWMLKTRSIRTLYYYYYLFYYYYYSWIDSNVTFWAQSRASAWESDDAKFIPEFILDRWNSSVIQFGSADTRKTSRVL